MSLSNRFEAGVRAVVHAGVQGGPRWLVLPVLLLVATAASAANAPAPAQKFTEAQVKKILMSKTWNLANDNSYYISGYKSVADYTDLHVTAPTPAPFKPQYQKEYDAIRKAASEGRNLVDLKAGCKKIGIPFGVPHNLPYGSRNFIFTDDRRLYIELGNGPKEFRKIWMDGRPLPKEVFMPQFQGYSRGRWEGASFVIETIGLRNDVQAEDGMVLSPQLRVTERYTLENENLLRLDLTLVDPVKFTRPWKPVPIHYFPEAQGDVEEQWLTFMDDTCEGERSNYIDGQTRLIDAQGRDLGAAPLAAPAAPKPKPAAPPAGR